MNKKTMLIISLIFSILALLYLISDYYGGNRYIMMHMKDHDNYIKNYTKLQKASKERVIVCFSNSDPNLPNINPFLNSISSDSSSSLATSSESSGFFSGLQNISIYTWLIIILLLSEIKILHKF